MVYKDDLDNREDIVERENQKPYISLPVALALSPEDLFCAQDEDGDNELMLAVIKRLDQYAIHIIDLLHKRRSGKYLNLKNKKEQTVIHLSVLTNTLTVSEKLIEVGVDLEARDHHGNTALHCACSMGSIDHVTVLTKEKTNKSQPTAKQLSELENYKGWNSLHLAVENGYADVAEHLVMEVGLDVNKRGGGRGMTALHIAAQKRDVTMVLFVLRNLKADVNLPTYDNWTVVKFATFNQDDVIVSVLLSAGAYSSDVSNCHEETPDGDSEGED